MGAVVTQYTAEGLEVGPMAVQMALSGVEASASVLQSVDSGGP